MVVTAIYSVTMVLWKETAFPLCRAMVRRWKVHVVSREYTCTTEVAKRYTLAVRYPLFLENVATSCERVNKVPYLLT